MPRAKADPEIVARALELLELGCSYREAGETLGVTAPTIQRWKKETAAAPPKPPPSEPAPADLPAHMAPPPAVAALVVGEDLIASTRAMVNRMLTRSAASESAGSYASAQRDSRDAANLMIVLARLEKLGADDADVVRVTRADVAKIEESLKERIAAICNRPLLCAECSRALSVRWGTGSGNT